MRKTFSLFAVYTPAKNCGQVYTPTDVRITVEMNHAGDMPQLETDAYGNARLTAVLPGLALEGANGIVGGGMGISTIIERV